MRKHRNSEWNLPASETLTWEQASFAVLLDIREELRTLNLILRCPNFTRIPAKLDAIKRNTARPRKQKKPSRKK
jgi:hypothetical protein